MTELEAVNSLLAAIGQVGVASLQPEDSNVSVEQALRELRRTSRQVQTRGWHWNTLEDYPLTPGTDGTVQLPSNVLKLDTVGTSGDVDAVQRGRRLYNRDTNTFTFEGTVKVRLVEALEWDDLPACAQWYVMVKATRRFATAKLASDTANKFTMQDEQEALIEMEHFEAESDDRTMRQASPHVARMRRS